MKIEILGLSVSTSGSEPSDILRFVCDSPEAAYGVVEALDRKGLAFEFSPELTSLSKRREVIVPSNAIDRADALNLIASVIRSRAHRI